MMKTSATLTELEELITSNSTALPFSDLFDLAKAWREAYPELAYLETLPPTENLNN